MSHHRKHADVLQSGSAEPTTGAQPTVASGPKGHNAPIDIPEAIRLCAYRKWENAGKPNGDGVRIWLEAEHELVQGK